MNDKVYKLNFLILILSLVLCSCNSITNSNKIDIAQKKLTNLDIRLPFESSNNVYEGEINFELHNDKGIKMESEFDTVTKTGGHIKYLLEKGNYSYFIKTPFNEVIERNINIVKDSALYFYKSCYDKIKELSLNDLKNSEKINISVTYEFDAHSNDEIEITKKENQYFLTIKENNYWTNKISIDSIQAINALDRFEKSISRMYKNEVIGTEKYSYISASQVFIKYDNKLYEVHNIKHDSLLSVTNELKRNINKIL